ncbi:MAG TPA: isochorismatase family protein [Burkholderiales bacterium]|nr:isochorismatase family protein [Burkholderiales bacterium]
MLLNAEQSSLLIIDMQKKVLDLVREHERVTRNCKWLMRLADKIGVPVAATCHYPEGLGPVVDELRRHVPAQAVRSKVHFSCVAARCLDDLPVMQRPQVVIAGIETHVCVWQSAADFRAAGTEVFVVADAVSSRQDGDTALALERMTAAGIHVVSREMVLFEWLRQAATPLFREVSREFLRG